MPTHLSRALMLLALLAVAAPAFPCSRTSPVSVQDILQDADAIVRATATGAGSGATVRFHVLEVIRGKDVPADFDIDGTLTGQDDFNDHEAPYGFVRPGGRSGNCYATSYRTGGQFLLMLKGTNGKFNANWYALGPTNEQLHSEQDRWLLWVREQEQKKKQPR